jgi:hypothetical protein
MNKCPCREPGSFMTERERSTSWAINHWLVFNKFEFWLHLFSKWGYFCKFWKKLQFKKWPRVCIHYLVFKWIRGRLVGLSARLKWLVKPINPIKNSQIHLKTQVKDSKASSKQPEHTTRGPWNDRLGEGRKILG